MASIALAVSILEPAMDRELDAARALLGVSPSTSLLENSVTDDTYLQSIQPAVTTVSSGTLTPPAGGMNDGEEPILRRPRSDSAGLDALAALASRERPTESPFSSYVVSHGLSSSDSDDSDVMPPPPPRRRKRSASNPEGMEKWDSLSRPAETSRMHFVLPASIIEQELAQVSEVMKRREERLPYKTIPEDEEYESSEDQDEDQKEDDDIEEEDLSNLSPEDLLKRARARLLEDLLEGKMNGDKGVLTLPHSLDKYKEVGFLTIET